MLPATAGDARRTSISKEKRNGSKPGRVGKVLFTKESRAERISVRRTVHELSPVVIIKSQQQWLPDDTRRNDRHPYIYKALSAFNQEGEVDAGVKTAEPGPGEVSVGAGCAVLTSVSISGYLPTARCVFRAKVKRIVFQFLLLPHSRLFDFNPFAMTFFNFLLAFLLLDAVSFFPTRYLRR